MNVKKSFTKFGILIILIVISALPLVSCGPKITSNEVVEKLRGLSDLTTTKYTMRVVVSNESKLKGVLHVLDLLHLTGKKMLVVSKGKVEAGINLNQLQPSDVIVSDDGKSITVNLPPVMIRNRSNCVSTNPEDTYVYDSSKGIFYKNPNKLTELIDLVNQEVVKAACEEGIMHQASMDAKAVIEKFLKTILPTVNITVNSGKEPSLKDCIGE